MEAKFGIMCKTCGDVLVSHHRHDFRRCRCENGVFIDGGQADYIRVGGDSGFVYVNVTERKKKDES